jgi:cytochrome P450
VIGDILGVPDGDRPRILHFGELGAPSLDIGLSWQQYLRMQQGIAGFETWLAAHLQQLRRHPGDDLMSQLIQAGEKGGALSDRELQATAEEILRLDSPVQLSARVAGKDTEVAGTPVQGGELIVIHLAGANRDPKVFPDPHRCDIARENARMVVAADRTRQGAHRCRFMRWIFERRCSSRLEPSAT